MRIAFNARLLTNETLRGWNRYAVNLISQLENLGVQILLYSDREIAPSHRARFSNDIQIRVSGKMPYVVWEQVWLPWQVRQDEADVLHSPFNFGLPLVSPCPRVLTLHDIIDDAFHLPRMRLKDKMRLSHVKSRAMHRLSRICAQQVITVSEYSKSDLIERLGLNAEKITVTHEAADPHFHVGTDKKLMAGVLNRYHLQTPYFFYVGGWEERKNIEFLIRAFGQAALPDMKLVLAGGTSGQKEKFGALAASLGLSRQIKFLEWVSESDLPALYAHAQAFVYPSSYEGFGLQICEAMAMSCPVLAARATSLPEIVGDGGELFNLEDPDELAQLLRKISTHADFRTSLSARAKARSKDFDWGKTARETLQVYRELIQTRTPQ